MHGVVDRFSYCVPRLVDFEICLSEVGSGGDGTDG